MNKIDKKEIFLIAFGKTVLTFVYAATTFTPVVLWYVNNDFNTNELMVLGSFVLGCLYGVLVANNQ